MPLEVTPGRLVSLLTETRQCKMILLEFSNICLYCGVLCFTCSFNLKIKTSPFLKG